MDNRWQECVTDTVNALCVPYIEPLCWRNGYATEFASLGFDQISEVEIGTSISWCEQLKATAEGKQSSISYTISYLGDAWFHHNCAIGLNSHVQSKPR